jgi:predicted MFS family arabinose efflux permease
MIPSDSPASRLATRLAFLVAGFGVSCWAPLVPFAKQRLGVDDAALGLLLLCLGAGSLAAMVAAGPLIARRGSRLVIVGSGIVLALALPSLTLAATPAALGGALLVFGGALGALDVAMNVHAVEVERAAGTPLMSGFHALYSIGGFAGSAVMTLLLSLKIAAPAGAALCAVPMLAAILAARPRLLMAGDGQGGPMFVRPRGIVLLLAGLAMATFLTEGAMLDWGALLISRKGLAGHDQAGIGYILFSIAMTIGRLSGDRLTARLGNFSMLVAGGGLAVLGFAVLLAAPLPAIALSGFLLIGLGASNVVPALFRRAGTQASMPPAFAIGAMSTLGYAGILAGPAAIGFVARAASLPAAFWILAGLMMLVPLTARQVADPTRP